MADVQLLLLQCGPSESAEPKAPLSEYGYVLSELAGRSIASLNDEPDVIVCSTCVHARKYARIIRRIMDKKARIVSLAMLAPTASSSSLSDILDNVAKKSNFEKIRVLGCIVHEHHFAQLAASAVNEPKATLNSTGAIFVTAASWLDMKRGNLRDARPLHVWVDDYRYPPETELYPKLQSKMQVSSILAGFTFTALIAVVEAEKSIPSDPRRGAAIVCLTLAIGLFVASVYIYDRLAMPRAFWRSTTPKRSTTPERPRHAVFLRIARILQPQRFRQDVQIGFLRDRLWFGLIYAYMVWTWRYLFTGGVIFALAGFLGLVFLSSDWIIAGLTLGAAVLVMVLYLVFRPRLGHVD